MRSYRVVTISANQEVIYVCRESERNAGRPSLSQLVFGARHGHQGARFDHVRTCLRDGFAPVYEIVASGLDKQAADDLVRRYRDNYDVHPPSPRRGGPRIHQKMDPDSPYLDPSPIYYVYELIRPDTGKVFYVGKGSSRHEPRINVHIRKAKRGAKGHKFSVIRKLLATGRRPVENRVLKNADERSALIEETRHIDSLGLSRLCNHTQGGQSAPTGDNHWTRRFPDRVLRGEKHPHYGKRLPDVPDHRRARGQRHGMAKLTNRQIGAIRRRYGRGGVTQTALAEEYGVSTTHIGRILRASCRGGSAVLSRHGNAKLTGEQRAEIRRRLRNGERGVDVAREFGVSASLISHIKGHHG